MEQFDFFVRIYDKNGCSLYVCGFYKWEDAYRRYKALEKENAASEWYIELTEVKRRNWR